MLEMLELLEWVEVGSWSEDDGVALPVLYPRCLGQIGYNDNLHYFLLSTSPIKTSLSLAHATEKLTFRHAGFPIG
jgi:hypothetical protein